MKTKTIAILLLIILSGIFYYYLTEPTGNVIKEKQTAQVIRVIDGDTLETNLGKIRLLGINTPEKKQPFHDEAEEFLNNLTLNKTVELEITGKDKYDRYLAYIFIDNEIINQKVLENGFANLYYYGKDQYYDQMKNSEEFARKNELGIWKKSSKSFCVSLIELDYTEETRCTNQEILILNNSCQEINVIIKDDANHIENIILPSGIYTQKFSCIFNDEGDSLYIRDSEGLILFYRYQN